MILPVAEHFACSPWSVGAARAFVNSAISDFDLDRDALTLLVSELASNAVRHARTPFDVSVSETADGVRIAVSDGSVRGLVSAGRGDADGGFGLDLVGAFAEHWGVEPNEAGKEVWFELPARRAARVETDPQQPTYSIGAVSRLLGIGTPKLRAWEQRYGMVVPFRSSGGHRLYSRDQMDQLRFVVNQIDSGVSAADAHRLLEQRIGEVTFVPTTPGPSLVLVAERDHYAAELSEYFLRTEGYEVRIALDGEEAHRLQQQRRPDLVILELLLPGGVAVDLCHDLAAAGIPVLAVSSLAMRDAAVDAGASAFLVKPFDPLRLVSMVRDLIGTSAFASAAEDRVASELTAR